MATSIDGKLDIGGVSVGSISLDPGANLIGRVIVEDGANPLQADVVGGALHTSGSSIGTASTPGSTPVGIVATSIIPANPARKLFSVTNPETTDLNNIMYLGGAGVTVGTGTPVYPGETYEDDKGTMEWWGIFVVAGLTVPWSEMT